MLLQVQIWALWLLQESEGISFDPRSVWGNMGIAANSYFGALSLCPRGRLASRLIGGSRSTPPANNRVSSLLPSPARCVKVNSTKPSRSRTVTTRATWPRLLSRPAGV